MRKQGGEFVEVQAGQGLTYLPQIKKPASLILTGFKLVSGIWLHSQSLTGNDYDDWLEIV